MKIPFKVRQSGDVHLSAQPVGFFKQCDGVTLLGGSDGSPHTGGAAAHHGDFLWNAGGMEQIRLCDQCDIGVDRAAVTFSHTPETGGYILAPALPELYAHVRIRQILTCHGNEIRFPFGNELLHLVRIAKTAHRSHQTMNAPLLKFFRKLQVPGTFLGGVIAAHMGIGALQTANLENVHQSFAELAEVQPVLHIIARLLFLCGGLDLNEKVLTAGFLYPAEHRKGKPCPFLQGIPTPLVGSLVEHRRNCVCQNGGTVAHIEGDAVKADAL